MPDSNHPILILDNIRSCHNVGSILRTCDGAGIHHVYACGITPYPEISGDTRQQHIITNNSKQIHKTALGAEETLMISHRADSLSLVNDLQHSGYQIYALENNQPNTQNIFSFTPTDKFALILGSETDGISPDILKACNAVLEIPMRGQKNSLNVSVAAGIALYQLVDYSQLTS